MKKTHETQNVPVRDGDVLGWFEDMAYLYGEHPVVLLGQPRTMKDAGIDPARVRADRSWMDMIVAFTFAPAYLWLRRQYRKNGIGHSSWSIELTLDRWKAIGVNPPAGDPVDDNRVLQSPARLSLDDVKKKTLPAPRNQKVEPPSAMTDYVSNPHRQQAAADADAAAKRVDPPPVAKPVDTAGMKRERVVDGVPVHSELNASTGGRRFVVFGLRTTDLLRWFGATGWPAADVRTVFRRLGIGVTDDTVKVQMSVGRTNKSGAPLTVDQVSALEGLAKGIPWTKPAPPPATTKPSAAKPTTARPATGKPARPPVRTATRPTAATRSTTSKKPARRERGA